MGMGTGNMRRDDNIMNEMAREVNLINHDLQHNGKEADPRKRKAGLLAFWCVLAFILLVIALFVIL